MKKFSEFRDNLTSEQAGICSFVISIVITLIFGILLFYTFVPNFVTVLMISMFLVFALTAFFNFVVFKTTEKKYNEGIGRAKQPIIFKYGLTKESYTEVKYNANTELLNAIINNPDCKFYAKFNDNEEIELIAKNKDGNVIYSEIISNFDYDYFQTFFEKIS